MEITLAKALKLKNILVRELNSLNSRLLTNNSYLKNNAPKYNVIDVGSEIAAKRQELVNLKVAIQVANVGIVEKLILLGELKNYAANLNSLQTQEGEVTSYHQNQNNFFECVINQVSKDEMVKVVQTQIDNLQDDIDTFNATTKITI